MFDLINDLPHLFGLKSFSAGQQFKSQNGQFVEDFSISLLWAADLAFYYAERVIVSVMHTDKGIKGVLLVPEKDYLSKVVSLDDWHDPVKLALRGINLTPDFAMSIVELESISITVSTPLTFAKLIVDMDDREASFNTLSQSLFFTIGKIVDLYDDPEWRNLLTTRYSGE